MANVYWAVDILKESYKMFPEDTWEETENYPYWFPKQNAELKSQDFKKFNRSFNLDANVTSPLTVVLPKYQAYNVQRFLWDIVQDLQDHTAVDLYQLAYDYITMM